MKTYIAHRIEGAPIIDVFRQNRRRYRLRPCRSQRVINHSPTGFEWGYGGSGPAQLALAILLDLTDDRELARKYYMPFKWDLIHPAQSAGFSLDENRIREWLDKTPSNIKANLNQRQSRQ